MLDRNQQNQFKAPEWAPDRWKNIKRNYTPEDVAKLAGSLPIQHSLAENGAKKLWHLLHTEDYQVLYEDPKHVSLVLHQIFHRGIVCRHQLCCSRVF